MESTEFGLAFNKDIVPPPYDDFVLLIQHKYPYRFNRKIVDKTWRFIQDKGWRTRFDTITKDWISYSIYWYNKIFDKEKYE